MTALQGSPARQPTFLIRVCVQNEFADIPGIGCTCVHNPGSSQPIPGMFN